VKDLNGDGQADLVTGAVVFVGKGIDADALVPSRNG